MPDDQTNPKHTAVATLTESTGKLKPQAQHWIQQLQVDGFCVSFDTSRAKSPHYQLKHCRFILVLDFHGNSMSWYVNKS